MVQWLMRNGPFDITVPFCSASRVVWKKMAKFHSTSKIIPRHTLVYSTRIKTAYWCTLCGEDTPVGPSRCNRPSRLNHSRKTGPVLCGIARVLVRAGQVWEIGRSRPRRHHTRLDGAGKVVGLVPRLPLGQFDPRPVEVLKVERRIGLTVLV